MIAVSDPARFRRRIVTSANIVASKSACLWECPMMVSGKIFMQMNSYIRPCYLNLHVIYANLELVPKQNRVTEPKYGTDKVIYY